METSELRYTADRDTGWPPGGLPISESPLRRFTRDSTGGSTGTAVARYECAQRPAGRSARRAGAVFEQTIFIVLDAGTAIRNSLRTDVMQVLKQCSGLRIVIF